jgi:hypothetical protein
MNEHLVHKRQVFAEATVCATLLLARTRSTSHTLMHMQAGALRQLHAPRPALTCKGDKHHRARDCYAEEQRLIWCSTEDDLGKEHKQSLLRTHA